jgi:hypothetical protein
MRIFGWRESTLADHHVDVVITISRNRHARGENVCRNGAKTCSMLDRAWVAPHLPGQRPMTPCWRISATVALFVVMLLGLVAQEPFTNVQYALHTGDDVFVTDETGLETRGRVTEVQPFTLRLRVNGADRLWRWRDVDRLERRGDSLKNGIIAGLTTGGILGFFQ